MLFFKKKQKDNSNYSVRFPVPKKLDKEYTFTVVGTEHLSKEIAKLGTPSKWYNASKEMLKTSNKGRHYEYYFGDLFYSMVPEPGNPYDNKAIAVFANAIKIGYVPAVLTDIVRAYMKHKNVRVSGSLLGGNYIVQDFGKWSKVNGSYFCEITITLP